MSKDKKLYVAAAGNTVKIGISNNPESRVQSLNTGNPEKIKLIQTHDSFKRFGKTASEFEDEIHDHLSEYHVRGEWFELECLPELNNYLNAHSDEAGLNERQETVVAALHILTEEAPARLVELESGSKRIQEVMPEVKMFNTLADAYDLPHWVCMGCGAVAYPNIGEDNRCHRCSMAKESGSNE